MCEVTSPCRLRLAQVLTKTGKWKSQSFGGVLCAVCFVTLAVDSFCVPIPFPAHADLLRKLAVRRLSVANPLPM